jgi:hypothetical protein
MTARPHDPETIERELAELGEAPPSADELAMLDGRGELGELDELGEGLDEDPELATVARLYTLAEPFAFEDLSQLETHRGWRMVEQRLAGAADPARASRPEPASPSTTNPHQHGGGPRRWLLAAVGAAAAAALLVLVLRPEAGPSVAEQATPVDPAAAAELGEQARATLATLAKLDGGLSETERAEQLAREYQRRLEELDG